MLEQQDFEFARGTPAPQRRGSRYAEYARLLAMFLKLYFQARWLMAQNWMLGLRLQLLELPLVYLKFEVFLVRFSAGIPIDQCWPLDKPARRV